MTATKEQITAFRASLAKLADVYVLDAFATAHRGHSSMLGEGYTTRCMGLLVQKELQAFSALLDAPARPVLGICGGYKLNKVGEILPLVEANPVGPGGGGAQEYAGDLQAKAERQVKSEPGSSSSGEEQVFDITSDGGEDENTVIVGEYVPKKTRK